MKSFDIQDPSELLISTSSLVISVVPQAWILHRQLGEYFIENRKRPDFMFSEIENECRFLIAYLDYLIAWQSCWMSTASPLQRMERHIRKDVSLQELLDNTEFHTATDDLARNVSDFIGADNWNHYFLKQPFFNRVHIEKSVDYRIYEWTKAQYEQRRQPSEYE